MTNQYVTFKNAHQDAFNAFPIFFAFDEKQFVEGMAKFGLVRGKDEGKLLSIGGGGYIRATDEDALIKLDDDFNEGLAQRIKESDEFAFDAICYELANHEWGYTRSTYSRDDALKALNLSYEDICKDQRLAKIYATAKRQCIKEQGEDY